MEGCGAAADGPSRGILLTLGVVAFIVAVALGTFLAHRSPEGANPASVTVRTLAPADR